MAVGVSWGGGGGELGWRGDVVSWLAGQLGGGVGDGASDTCDGAARHSKTREEAMRPIEQEVGPSSSGAERASPAPSL